MYNMFIILLGLTIIGIPFLFRFLKQERNRLNPNDRYKF
jgi:hypothetical protein